MGRRLFTLLLSLMVMIPSLSFANDSTELADNEPPRILDVSVVSDVYDEGGGYDKVPPLFDKLRTSIGFQNGTVIGQVAQQVKFNISVRDELSGVKKVSIVISKPSETISVDLRNQFSDIWNNEITVDEAGEWVIEKITAEDNTGNISELDAQTLKILVLPDYYQLYNSNSIRLTDNHKIVKISFSKEMNSESFNSNSVQLIEASSQHPQTYRFINDFKTTLSDDKKSLFVLRENPYIKNKEYTLVIHDSVMDLKGIKLSNPMYINLAYIESEVPPPPTGVFVNLNFRHIVI